MDIECANMYLQNKNAMLKPFGKIFLPAIFCLLAIAVVAQPPRRTNVKPPAAAQKTKPKFKSTIDNISDSAVITVDAAQHLVAQPIIVTDEKKIVYKITSYQIVYRRLVVTEDEATGKASPATSMVSNQFGSTPLPDIWKNVITEELQPGEELYIFDIVVKDAQGKLYFAPDIKIKTK
jgi:hypothetical protein